MIWAPCARKKHVASALGALWPVLPRGAQGAAARPARTRGVMTQSLPASEAPQLENRRRRGGPPQQLPQQAGSRSPLSYKELRESGSWEPRGGWPGGLSTPSAPGGLRSLLAPRLGRCGQCGPLHDTQ